jgi:putative transposase
MSETRPDHPTPAAVSQTCDVGALSTYSELVRAQALERFKTIRPFLEEGIPLLTLAQQHDMSTRTLQRWVRQYQQGGLVALCRKPRADTGTHRAFSPELVEVIEALALQIPRLSVATISRQVAALATQRGLVAPSYDRVYDIVRQMDPAILTLAHQGAQVYSQTFDLLYRREAEAPNEIWQADHTLLDLVVSNDKGLAQKPWLTVIIDDYSRALAGYMLSFEAPSALHTALALRQAIWRKTEPRWQVCGIPAVLYTDHGSDFTSAHLEQVCADLNIRPVFSQVGKPRGRGRVERFFNTVNQLLLSRLPGYAPAGYAAKATPGLDLQGLNQAFERFILDDYHLTPHSVTDMPPQVRWHNGGFLPRLPESLEQLDLLLLSVAKPRIIHRDGIRFQGLRYIDLTLAAYIGERVTIRYDPRDMVEIRIYYRQRFLCRAVCQELTGETVGLKDIIRARRRRKRDLQEQIDKRQSLVDQLLASSTPNPSPSQAMVVPNPASQSHKKLKRYEND